jgi:hypothetical protein
VFISPRHIETYANIVPAKHPAWQVVPAVAGPACRYVAQPALAIHANGQLAVCCGDLDGHASFGNLHQFGDLKTALTSEACNQFFAELGQGVFTKPGCQICQGQAVPFNPAR